MKFINWIKRFYESKGEPSSKRATLFALVILYIGLNIYYVIHVLDGSWRYYQLILNGSLICLFAGIATFENIINFVQSIKGGLFKKDKEDEPQQ